MKFSIFILSLFLPFIPLDIDKTLCYTFIYLNMKG